MSALCSPPHPQRATELKYGKKRVCRVNNCHHMSPGGGETCPQHPLCSLRSLCGCAPRAHTCVLLPKKAREPPYRPPSASPASSVLGTGC